MHNYGVIFDCDGTLLNSLGHATTSFNWALEKIGEARRTPDEIKKFFGRGANRIFLQLLGDETKAQRAFDSYCHHQSELALDIQLFPGIQELLQGLNELDVPMAIVTGRHERDLEAILSRHNLGKYFVTMIADNHLPKSKPAPDGILLAASRLKLDASNTYYVGDSTMDLQAAKAAGAKSVAALWDPLVDIEDMNRENPTHQFSRPIELLSIFE
ncbi:MAG: HAD family hydrolase [Bdellovibrio sp.]|nr:HAD family hydrolase [Bdellovibrio sp.]